MIQLTRLNGERFALNTDLIERIEETPDTVLTLIDGTKYVVGEPIEDVIDRVIHFRARVVATAEQDEPVTPLQLVHASGDAPDSTEPAGSAGSAGGDSNASPERGS